MPEEQMNSSKNFSPRRRNFGSNSKGAISTNTAKNALSPRYFVKYAMCV